MAKSGMARRVRRSLVDLVAASLWRTGLSRPDRRANGTHTIVTFHRVLPAPELAQYPFPGLAVTPEQLDWTLGFLAQHYDVGPVSEHRRAAVEGQPTTRPRLSVTFDDGQWDNLEHAAPVLQAHGVAATFYVPVEPVRSQQPIWHDQLGFALASLLERGETGAIGEVATAHGVSLSDHDDGDRLDAVVEGAKRLDPPGRRALVESMQHLAGAEAAVPAWARLMTLEEVRALAQQGHEIGSHSMSHELLPQLDDDALRHEVEGSKAALEEVVQQPVRSFCYPNGDNDARTRAAVAAAGYENAVTTAWGRNAPTADPFGLVRCHVDAERFRDRRGEPSPERAAMRLGALQLAGRAGG